MLRRNLIRHSFLYNLTLTRVNLAVLVIIIGINLRREYGKLLSCF